jgi:hypothetical protein
VQDVQPDNRQRPRVLYFPGELPAPRLKFHCDENCSKKLINSLRERGLNVTSTPQVHLCHQSDVAQLRYAASSRRVMVTHDEMHFPELARNLPHAGVLVCRGGGRYPEAIVSRCLELKAARAPFVRRRESAAKTNSGANLAETDGFPDRESNLIQENDEPAIG